MPHADALTPSLREESLPLDHLRLLEVHAAVAPPPGRHALGRIVRMRPAAAN